MADAKRRARNNHIRAAELEAVLPDEALVADEQYAAVTDELDRVERRLGELL